ncbi:MAG TPA: type 4a pilus biogenesis protein PilO [Candidatus Hydrogenedentes bacterium]|nr:type 4a pilus biogenesis protein PilO [Candidatus Hydrogenedentota bacterium]
MLDLLQGKITKKDWIFVGGVIAVAVVLAVLYFAVAYRYFDQKAETERQRIASIQKELDEAKKIASNIVQLREEAAQMRKLVEGFRLRLPEEREIPTLLNRIEMLGAELGLRVQLSTLPTKVDRKIEVIPYKVTAMGQFHPIVTFMNMLERDKRYFKLGDIDIGEEKEGVSTATFTLSTFRFIAESSQSSPSDKEKEGAQKDQKGDAKSGNARNQAR